MKNVFSLQQEFMDSVVQIVYEDAPENVRFYAEHKQLMEEDSQYNAAFRKYEELLKSEEAIAFRDRIDAITETTWGKPLRENFLIFAESLKHVPFTIKTEKCGKQMMESFDRKFG